MRSVRRDVTSARWMAGRFTRQEVHYNSLTRRVAFFLRTALTTSLPTLRVLLTPCGTNDGHLQSRTPPLGVRLDTRIRRLRLGRYARTRPLISLDANASFFIGMLVGMITVYYAQGKGPYFWQNSHIPFISDIGASFLQPLFIAGSCVTSACFIASLAIERLLRHHGRLHADLRRREMVFSYLAIFGAVIASVGLISLSCLNDRDHKTQVCSLLVTMNHGS